MDWDVTVATPTHVTDAADDNREKHTGDEHNDGDGGGAQHSQGPDVTSVVRVR